MALDFTPQTVSSGHQSTDTIEENNTNIQTALADGVSRSGNAPNAMAADFDMNSNRILNLPNATANGEPVTYQQWAANTTTVEFDGYLNESQIATAGQTTFTTSNTYTPGLGALRVYINGVYQDPSSYTETDANTVTLSAGVDAGDRLSFVISSFTSTSSTGANNITYTPAGSSAVASDVQTKLRETRSVKDYGATGDGVTDDTSAIQAALDDRGHIYFPPGVYIVSSTLTVTDTTRLEGANAYMGIRDHEGEDYDGDYHTVIKYTGAGGSNSVVLRCSDVAVGTAISDVTPPGTDDLFDVIVENITIDGNALAECGIYCYRNIECQYNRVATMQCKEYGWYIGASFENTWVDCTAFSNEKNGWEIGTAMGGLTATQMRVNGNLFLRPSARYNGTGKSYNESTNAGEGNGFYLHLSAGNDFVHIDAEVNDGAGIFITNDTSSSGGPAIFRGGYLEGNMADVVGETRGSGAYELYIAYRANTRHFVFDGVYISGSQDGVLITQSGGAPSQGEHYVKFRDCYSGSSQLDIDSNTIGFKVEDCAYASGIWSYSTSTPGVQELSGPGAINEENLVTRLTTTGADAFTLADGKEGNQKIITMVADGGNGTLTPTSLLGYTTITFNDVGDSVHLYWTGSDWSVLSAQGVSLA